MKIIYVWEACDYLNGEWVDEEDAVRSYWITAHLDELQHILTYAPNPERLQRDIVALASDDGTFYLLVAEDFSSMMALPAHFANSGQWNAYSPFEVIKKQEITTLEALKNLKHDYNE